MEDVVMSDVVPTTEPSIESVVVNGLEERNYSFSHRKDETLDTAECNGVTYPIPAAIGSSYWAIQKTLFTHFNQFVTAEALVKNVALLMEDRDPVRWEKYQSKTSATVFLKSQQKSIKKEVKPWNERILGNVDTMCRRKDYGKRLQERGFKIERGREDDKPAFKMVADKL